MTVGDRRTALLFGASGLVGGFVLEHLLASDRYARVTVVVRRSLGRTHPKLEEVVASFDALPSMSLPNADDTYVALGTTIAKAGSQEKFYAVDHDAVIAAGAAGKRAGATALALVSSVGADTKSGNFYLRVKGEAERDLEAQSWPTLEIMRPSLLLGERAEQRFGERLSIVLLAPLAFFFVGPLARYRPIEAERVALAMIEALARPTPGAHVREYEALASLTASRAITRHTSYAWLVIVLVVVALASGAYLLAR